MSAPTVEDSGLGGLPAHEPEFLGHPRGLLYLAFTEAWERFSFYGMQALLVLYMVDQLLKPGHIEHVIGFAPLRAVFWNGLAIQPLSSAIFGLYASWVYLTPVFGGFIGDLLIGRRKAIAIGAILMAIGHFLMALEPAFLFALAFLIVGCGFLKGNIASQVGRLYGPDDPRRSDGFQIFVLGINAGVILAPLICGTLGELVGWHYGFAAAGVGMLIALGIFLSGYKYMPADDLRVKGEPKPVRPPLTGADWKAIVALLALLPILSIAFVGNNQIFNVYMIWARDHANLTIGGFTAPVTWLQSIDAAASATCLVLVVVFWRIMAARGFAPNELTKLLIGFVLSLPGFALLTFAALNEANTGIKAPFLLLVAFHVLNSIAYANILPVALALYARAAPPSVNAAMIGIFYLLFYGTNQMVGWIGGYYEQLGPTKFWLLHGGFCAVAVLVIGLLYYPLRKVLIERPAAA